jgi:hypothetical protein
MNWVEFGDYEISSLWSEIPNNNIECKLSICVDKKWEMFLHPYQSMSATMEPPWYGICEEI